MPCSPVSVPPRRSAARNRSSAASQMYVGHLDDARRVRHGVEDEVRMQVAVARVRDGRDHDAVLALDARDLVEHRRQRAARHRHVLDERRAERLHRGMHRPADREQPLALRRGRARRRPCRRRRAAPRRSRPPRRPPPARRSGSSAARRPGVGGSSEQQRVDGGEGRGIHQLHDRRLHARRGDGGGCLGGRRARRRRSPRSCRPRRARVGGASASRRR